MNDRDLAAAARPARTAILRLTMMDYSIGHELLLQKYENPLVCLTFEQFEAIGLDLQIHAIMQAALVCSRTWEQNQKRARFVKFWSWFIRNSNWAHAIATFRVYRHHGSTFPDFLPPDKNSVGRALGGPLLGRLLAFSGLINGENRYNARLGELHWLYFCQLESQEGCRIRGDGELTESEAVQNLLEEIQAERMAEAKAREDSHA